MSHQPYNRDETERLRASLPPDHFESLRSLGLLTLPKTQAEEQRDRDAAIRAENDRIMAEQAAVEQDFAAKRNYLASTSGLSPADLELLTDADVLALTRVRTAEQDTTDANLRRLAELAGGMA